MDQPAVAKPPDLTEGERWCLAQKVTIAEMCWAVVGKVTIQAVRGAAWLKTATLSANDGSVRRRI
jgi:hypothetical protein